METLDAYSRALKTTEGNNPSDLDIIAKVNAMAARSANFQGLTGEIRNAYLSGCNTGVCMAMERLREYGVCRPRQEIVNNKKTTVYRFR